LGREFTVKGGEIVKNQNSDQNRERELEHDLEIVELQEKLDMSFDLLGLGVANLKDPVVKPNTNCGNTQCC
jgi:hypothetical protein